MDPYDLYACPGCGLLSGHRLDCGRRDMIIRIALDAANDLAESGATVLFTEAYEQAEAGEDWSEVERLEVEQDALVAAFTEAVTAAAVEAGAERGVEVEVIAYKPGQDEGDELLAEDAGGLSPAGLIWETAHNRVGVDVREDGTWSVE